MNVLALALAVAVASSGAPSDQYFGSLKMSALRIRYEIGSIRDRYETHKLLPEEAMHLAVLVQNAFGDWAKKYPKDDWLPSTGYNFAKLYEELPGNDARDRAVALLIYVKSNFPATKYAASSRNDLHRGLAVRPDPAWAVELRASKAAPSPSPASTAPSTAPSASPAPSPTASGRRGLTTKA
ncbi:MAG: hypothetical protein JO192_12360 [Candidatus Eremiobacteraeota bacterium]|nr:hypothetical protein [Candidatus Eremiobacteraeota bacterium]